MDIITALTPFIVPEEVSLLPVLAACFTPQQLWDSFSGAIASLASGFPLADFSCPACGACHIDHGKFATTTHIVHLCACGHKWHVRPASIGNPLARWNPTLVDG